MFKLKGLYIKKHNLVIYRHNNWKKVDCLQLEETSAWLSWEATSRFNQRGQIYWEAKSWNASQTTTDFEGASVSLLELMNYSFVPEWYAAMLLYA